ncbi:MAG: precorrin-6Y C5,15-methyltransferase (decarboxylating) subunit CbiT [Clostridiales bacterium 38-18]|nr:MAG: precorrin-6Y C5,15-methyltransferase (decarboxylating) subunit CbiT [Clostridiales bacterium 38-18]
MKDEAFIRGKNPMTKMEVRGTIISYLELESAHSVLEVGAGTGSVTIQMLKTNPTLSVVAIEKTSEGTELIRLNAEKHGVTLEILEGEASTLLKTVSKKFDRVYLGGTGRYLSEIMAEITPKLEEGAVIVFSVITLESLNEIFAYVKDNEAFKDLEASQIQASRLEMLGSYHYFKPLNPCYVIKVTYGS